MFIPGKHIPNVVKIKCRVFRHNKNHVEKNRNTHLENNVSFKLFLFSMFSLQIKRLPEPYGKCVSDGDLEYLSGSYTKAKCFLECETKFVVERCGCRIHYMPGKKETDKSLEILVIELEFYPGNFTW